MSEEKKAFRQIELTDHKINPFNERITIVNAVGRNEVDTAVDKYHISVMDSAGEVVKEQEIAFQRGNADEVGVNGISDQALLAILIDRQKLFNEGPFRCYQSQEALNLMERAIISMKVRAKERRRREVEGKQEVLR